jgi:hypothetical protein
MRRRELIGYLGCAAAMPFIAPLLGFAYFWDFVSLVV